MITVRRVWLIRHGQSESNAGLPTNGPGASPLTERGRRQAARMAETFTEPPALIVSSPFLRARQTAEPTMERFPEVPHEEWPVQEFTFLGRLHGPQTTGEQRRPFADAYWRRLEPGYVHGHDGESFQMLITRARAFLDRLAERPADGPVAVFTHGVFTKAVVWSLLSGVTEPDAAAMRAFRDFQGLYDVPNCSVVELWRPSGPYGWRVAAGATMHLAETFSTPATASHARFD